MTFCAEFLAYLVKTHSLIPFHQQWAQESLNLCRMFIWPRPKANKQSWDVRANVVPAGDSSMKNLSILVPAVMAGVLVAATVLAAPLSDAAKPVPAGAPDRAEAYMLATRG
jgi:hypothetical protein